MNKLEYTNADYSAIKENVIKNIQDMGGEWTDFNEADVGMVLLNAFAGIGDMLLYYLDRRSRETYINTAQLRQSIIDITQAFDYRLRRKESPEVKVTIKKKEEIQDSHVTIPRFTELTSKQGSNFLTIEYGEIRAGYTETELTAIRGELIEETFQGKSSNYQEYDLETVGMVENFFEVTVNGEKWEEDTGDPTKENTKNVYKLYINDEDEIKIIFSHIIGNVPTLGDIIVVRGVVDEEESSQVSPGVIDGISSSIPLHNYLEIKNKDLSTVGREREGIEEARLNAPKSLRSLWRAVTSEDYEVLSERFPGIGKAKAIKNLDLEDPWKTVEVCVTTEDGEKDVSEERKVLLKEYLEARNGVCTDVYISNAEKVPISIEVEVIPNGQYAEEVVLGNVKDILTEYFKFENQSFGGRLEELNTLGIPLRTVGKGIKMSDMYHLIDSMPGVRSLDYITLKREDKKDSDKVGNIDFEDREIAYLKTLDVKMGE